MSLENEVRYRLESNSNPSSDKYLLAVSGGRDSMILLNIFHALNINFVVAHMNYGLRGDDADLDEALVKRVCDEKGISYFSKRVNTEEFCDEHGYATQEGARILRYNWFEELLKDHQLSWIVTAHHEEDNKETFLQNLKRGSGLRGLKSMRTLHENKLKPMLFCSRLEIENYGRTNEVVFRQDASNNQNHYQRNLIRNKLLPAMEKQFPGIGRGISSSIEKLQQDYDFLEQQLQDGLKRHLVKKDAGWMIENYKELHPRLLFYILENFGFNSHQTQDVFNSSSSGKKIENESFIVQDAHGDLYVFENIRVEQQKVEVEGIGRYMLGDISVEISDADQPEQFEKNKLIAFVDADTLVWPLEIRNFKQGDRIKPIGMKGSKKLSDYFTDEKIPAHLRLQKKVVLSDGEIIWVVGELVSDKVKITQQTKKVLKFETLI